MDACSLGLSKDLHTCAHPQFPTYSENHRSHSNLTWSQMQAADRTLTQKIRDKAIQYGFVESCINDDIAETSVMQDADVFTLGDTDVFWK